MLTEQELRSRLVGWLAERHDTAALATLEPAVERYVRAVLLARAAWAGIPDKLLAEGSQGQQVAHPLIGVALNAEKAAARFEEDLGLSAKLVRGPGRPPGAVSAPDRRAVPQVRLVSRAGEPAARPGLVRAPGRTAADDLRPNGDHAAR